MDSLDTRLMIGRLLRPIEERLAALEDVVDNHSRRIAALEAKQNNNPPPTISSDPRPDPNFDESRLVRPYN